MSKSLINKNFYYWVAIFSFQYTLLNSGSSQPTWVWEAKLGVIKQIHLSMSRIRTEKYSSIFPFFTFHSSLNTINMYYLPEFAQTRVHWVDDVITPPHPLSPSSLALNLSQHQGLFQWVSSLLQVTKVLELQLQHQPMQWIFKVDFL